MAKLGIVVDLSHVGPKTTEDAIEYSPAGKPPCFSHILPCGLKEHPRNKSDRLIKLVGSKGGFVGLSQFGPHMEKGNESAIDDYVDALDYVIGLIGELIPSFPCHSTRQLCSVLQRAKWLYDLLAAPGCEL